MAAPMVATRYPGIYRRGSRYVVRYRADSRQRSESARTLDEARLLQSKRQREVADGAFREQSRQTFAEFVEEFIRVYQGRGKGFREATRHSYERDLTRYCTPFLGHLKL